MQLYSFVFAVNRSLYGLLFQFVIAKDRQDAMVIGLGQQGCRWILATCPSTFRHSQYREPL